MAVDEWKEICIYSVTLHYFLTSHLLLSAANPQVRPEVGAHLA